MVLCSAVIALFAGDVLSLATVHLPPICWPAWTAADRWRWLMVAFGLAMIGYGAFAKHMRIRDSRTWSGILIGRIATQRWQIYFVRAVFVALGLGLLAMAFTFLCTGNT